MVPSQKTFQHAISSAKLEKIDPILVEEFIEMLKLRRESLTKMYKGEIYSYHQYRSLQPKIKFSLENTVKKQEGAYEQVPNV